MKILYVMHVDWNWIKQRPHFIAEKLIDHGIELDVLYRKDFDRRVLVKNTMNRIFQHAIPRLPFERFTIVKKINTIIRNIYILKVLCKKNYDYVYITSPEFYSKVFSKQKVIYDCMDDMIEFSKDKRINEVILRKERSLVAQAEFVFFTSNHLQETVLSRYNINYNGDRFFINNNAIEILSGTEVYNNSFRKQGKINFVYIGTIASWFDFALLEQLIPENYVFHLFGPKEEGISVPENCIWYGPVNRNQIFSIMDKADILVMPFIVTDLIKSVNPVKLYEYIYSGKPTLCVRYGEAEKFSDFIDYYENSDLNSFREAVLSLQERTFNSKKSLSDCIAFAKCNNWDNRVDQILNVIR